MKNKYIVISLILLFIALSFFYQHKNEKNFSFDYQHTKAICSGNSCRDYLITCNDNEIVEMQALTGLIVFDENWEDPRKVEDKELCRRNDI